MPKVGASMANVSTSFVPVTPDTYLVTLEKPELKTKEGRNTFNVKSVIVAGDETGVENAGRSLFDNISMHKKDGEPNEFGSIQLKRYIEAAFPESKEWDEQTWDDFDTDALAGRQVKVVVVIEPDQKDPDVKYNKTKRVLSV